MRESPCDPSPHVLGSPDAAGNDVVRFQKHDDPSATVLSTTGQPVPTSLAWGPDGALHRDAQLRGRTRRGDRVPPRRPHRRPVGVRDWSHGHHVAGLRLPRSPLRDRVDDRLRSDRSVTRRRRRLHPLGRRARRPQGHRCRFAALPHGCRGRQRRRVRVELGHRDRRRTVPSGRATTVSW